MSAGDRRRVDGYKVVLGIGALLVLAGIGGVALFVVQVVGGGPIATTAPAAPTSSTTTTVAEVVFVLPDGSSPPTSIRTEGDGLGYELVADGLDQPVAAALVRGTEDAFYVLERFGRVVLVDDGDLVEVLDIRDRVGTNGAEQGLVGIALHPEFEQNGRVFLSYADVAGTLRIVEVMREPGRVEFTPDERVLLEVAQPGNIHQGGTLRFGPDGMLWIGLGDGGSQGDSLGHAQNPNTLLGSLLRIDVDSRTGDLPYGIPRGNAFPDGDGRPEIWAYGLRNPWHFAFDGVKVYIADVGQQRWEEINVVDRWQAGSNFGWASKDGPECFQLEDCEGFPAIDPVVPIPYDGLCALIGGPVYRGSQIPMLEGQLLWADYCNGFVASVAFEAEGPVITRWDGLGTIHLIAGFAEDAVGEVYVVQQSGQVFRIVWNP